MPRISAYLNIDNGSGRLRGVWGQGNEAAVRGFDQILLPFRDVGFVPSRLHNTGGTDHLSFDAADCTYQPYEGPRQLCAK